MYYDFCFAIIEKHIYSQNQAFRNYIEKSILIDVCIIQEH